MRTKLNGLYAITDEILTPDETVVSQVEVCLDAGVRIVQYRNKTKTDDEVEAVCRELQALCRQKEALFIIDDRPLLAQKIKADGLHIGKDDISLVEARKIFKDGIIGVSCYGSITKAKEAQDEGADYVAFGSFFHSPTKPKSGIVPLKTLQKAHQMIDIPICAIGGINQENISQVAQYHPHMISLVSAVFVGDIKENVHKLIKGMNTMKLKLAIEWFLNPDHLPFLVGIQEGIFAKYGLELEVIVPDEHYDGLQNLLEGNIQFATNEPLHLIEQFDDKFLSLGSYFETKGGVLLKREAYEKIKNNKSITVTTPVSNEKTDSIGFEIIRRYFKNEGISVTRNQVRFEPNGFEHIKYMKEGADAGWLYFYNFEGIEAQHEGMDVLYLDAKNTGFANFSALGIFTNKEFYKENTQVCLDFDKAVKESIQFMEAHPEKALEIYYDYTKDEHSPLMDDIIKATLECFNPNYTSSYEKALPVLNFFKDIGITSLEESTFKTAFLR